MLIDDVARLVAEGALSPHEGDALSSKLQMALRQLERGHVQPAANQINGFIRQVEALIRKGKLSPEQGQPLIEAAMAILVSLNG